MLGREAGENGMEGPPVPIPNTEVKLHRAEDTWWATARENRSLPALLFSLKSKEKSSNAGGFFFCHICCFF